MICKPPSSLFLSYLFAKYVSGLTTKVKAHVLFLFTSNINAHFLFETLSSFGFQDISFLVLEWLLLGTDELSPHNLRVFIREVDWAEATSLGINHVKGSKRRRGKLSWITCVWLDYPEKRQVVLGWGVEVRNRQGIWRRQFKHHFLLKVITSFCFFLSPTFQPGFSSLSSMPLYPSAVILSAYSIYKLLR